VAGKRFRRRRRNVARAAEHGGYVSGCQILNELLVHHIRRHARGLLGDAAFAKLDAYCFRTYARDHWYGFWCKVLTGGRVEFAFARVENRQPGQPAAVCTDWHEQQHMNREEFYALFPYNDPPPPESGFEAEAEAILARIRTGQAG
jgi:hypothetical protein